MGDVSFDSNHVVNSIEYLRQSALKHVEFVVDGERVNP
jgi:hypothetical protein